MKKKNKTLSSPQVSDAITPVQQPNNLAPTDIHDISGLLLNLREVIKTARQQVLHAVDVVQVQTCWTVGQHIVEFEQGGAVRAAYGKGFSLTWLKVLPPSLAKVLMSAISGTCERST